MPRQLITIQVGQCGNQIAMRFWDLALREHAKYNKSQNYDDALSSFFRNIDNQKGGGTELKVGSDVVNLQARAIVVDMEEGVINSMLQSEIGEIFDQRQFINDVSGAGNNWAHGHFEYGNKYQSAILGQIKKAVEQCDSLQCFFLMHSLGGGTGSGLGSRLIGLLEDEFPEIFRFSASVFPSKQDDVVTSPYNSLFSLNELLKHADCVFPIDNQALQNICYQIDNPTKAKLVKDNVSTKNDDLNIMMPQGSKITDTEEKQQKPFDQMNNIVAHLLSNITCSMRFEGVLNVDLNEISMNLVPYPNLHFLMSSIAPLYSLSDAQMQPRRSQFIVLCFQRLDQMFKDCTHPDYQLINANPIAHQYLALGMIVRGDVAFSDVNRYVIQVKFIKKLPDNSRNIKKLREELNMVHWNSEGFKYGICNTPPIGQPYSLLCMANNTGIQVVFDDMLQRFNKLYQKRVYVHHYTQYMPIEHFQTARDSIVDLYNEYEEIEKSEAPATIKRLTPLI